MLWILKVADFGLTNFSNSRSNSVPLPVLREAPSVKQIDGEWRCFLCQWIQIFTGLGDERSFNQFVRNLNLWFDCVWKIGQAMARIFCYVSHLLSALNLTAGCRSVPADLF